MIEIPVFFKNQSADFKMTIDLDNVSTIIRLTYNTRVDSWFATFETENNKASYVKLVDNFLILNQYKATLPEILGDFILKRVSDDLNNPELTYDNFGIDWKFYYLTSDEVINFKDEYGLI